MPPSGGYFIIREADTFTSSLFTITYYFRQKSTLGFREE